MYSQNAARKMH